MSAINQLPSHKHYSIIRKKDGFFLLSQSKSAWKLYADSIVNSLTGERVDYSGLSFLEDFLSRKRPTQFCDQDDDLWLVHAFYEMGLWWNDDGKDLKKEIPRDQLLGVIYEYQESTPFSVSELTQGETLKVEWKRPHPLSYEKAFKRGEEFLRRGDCYQYNLTFPFHGKIKAGNLAGLIKKLWAKEANIGEFAGLTVCEDSFFVTNTPECLFEWGTTEIAGTNASVLSTRPIKGTLSLEDEKDWQEVWQKLCESIKDESELYMITDLLRNDLNRIERPLAKVIKKKAPLVVPGLIHSYSHIEVELSPAVQLLTVMKALFPGGSITGAPKIRVMQIIDELEQGPRGFYCGSSIYPRDGKIVASINIRSAQGNSKSGVFTYHAGGGITVKSTWEQEYQEMENKFLSFQSLLTS